MSMLDNNRLIRKTTAAFSSAKKNTSCSRGWLRVAVQGTFCVITVASFILVLIMAIQRSSIEYDDYNKTKTCYTTSCTIICHEDNFDYEYEEEVYFAVLNGYECDAMTITFYKAMFPGGHLPLNWLTKIRADVTTLKITSGNLSYIHPHSFISTFTKKVKKLVLEGLTLEKWNSNMLIGLMKLESLVLKYCHINGGIKRNALRGAEDHLVNISITYSGRWDPANITGSATLPSIYSVDFSHNSFGDLLNRNSFRDLRHCRVLNLCSSQITSIGLGAFDYLEHIQQINLSDNFLVSVPGTIFDRILAIVRPSPTIELQNNLWVCYCGLEYLDLMTSDSLLMGLTCFHPEVYRGMSFSRFKAECEAMNITSVVTAKPPIDLDKSRTHNDMSIVMDNKCKNTSNTNVPSRIIYGNQYSCLNYRIHHMGYGILSSLTDTAKNYSKNSQFQLTFYIEHHGFSMVELISKGNFDLGIIWFKSNCPEEIYCIGILPSTLKILNVDMNSTYTVCTMDDSGPILQFDSCTLISASILDEMHEESSPKAYKAYIFVIALFGAGGFGAILLYGIIIRNPILLRGSKRVVIVKHKLTDAMVLPPQVPYRSFSQKTNTNNEPKKVDVPFKSSLSRSASMRSSSSGYVTAEQPTQQQLTEWRLQNHFSPSPLKQNSISWIFDTESNYYSSFPDYHIYESPIEILTNNETKSNVICMER
ncbi:uncharacterized protein LOC105386670 [Plutella xylostella]|uniref:uncharacterized protein LOC105386670 n=1 Tax=Plutella xylostella TaxID=51655 RepID=UPI00203291AA|nr:uncharacterized protein LOC105386670 [Plutella xylostella]